MGAFKGKLSKRGKKKPSGRFFAIKFFGGKEERGDPGTVTEALPLLFSPLLPRSLGGEDRRTQEEETSRVSTPSIHHTLATELDSVLFLLPSGLGWLGRGKSPLTPCGDGGIDPRGLLNFSRDPTLSLLLSLHVRI